MKWKSEAERLRAYRDRKRNGPPRPYAKRLGYLSPFEHQRARESEKAAYGRARAIAASWDDPLRRALMSRIKTDVSR